MSRPFLLMALCSLTPLLYSQVLAPAEIKDENARKMQEKYFVELKAIANNVRSQNFPYGFYLSRVLDVTEREQLRVDQRSISFDRFEGKLILKITGNYFASYSAEKLEREDRARQTFVDVMLPILQAAMAQFDRLEVPDIYGLEISHHVRRRVLGVWTEGMENLVLVVPRESARDLVEARDTQHQNVALLKASAFVDGKPMAFWPTFEPVAATKEGRNDPAAATAATAPTATTPTNSAEGNTSFEKLQERYRPDLDRMIRELDAQAHFVSYAPPTFIEFHKQRFLQLSLITTLPEGAPSSQYQMAALSFDQHISHLVRSVLAYLKNAEGFDGIDFSATVHSGAESALAVEYLLPLSALKKYESYDLTGQELLDDSFVLINGERVGLNLQEAEHR